MQTSPDSTLRYPHDWSQYTFSPVHLHTAFLDQSLDQITLPYTYQPEPRDIWGFPPPDRYGYDYSDDAWMAGIPSHSPPPAPETASMFSVPYDFNSGMQEQCICPSELEYLPQLYPLTTTPTITTTSSAATQATSDFFPELSSCAPSSPSSSFSSPGTLYLSPPCNPLSTPQCTPPTTTTPATSEPPTQEAQNLLLLHWRSQGISYKTIRARLQIPEAESTLRGRLRTLTKPKSERLRRPQWLAEDIKYLIRAVAEGRSAGIKWKNVSEDMIRFGGRYRFGPSTCKKKYLELVAEGLAPGLEGDDGGGKRRRGNAGVGVGVRRSGRNGAKNVD